MDKKGYVYVLSNPAMPGVVKIGRSKNGGHARAEALYSGATGVPHPFKVEFEILSEDAVALEGYVHGHIDDLRLNDSREFFNCDVDDAILHILKCYLCAFDKEIVGLDDFSAVDGAHVLAAHIDEEPQTVTNAICFVSNEAIIEAVKKQKESAKRVAEILRSRREAREKGEAACQTGS